MTHARTASSQRFHRAHNCPLRKVNDRLSLLLAAQHRSGKGREADVGPCHVNCSGGCRDVEPARRSAPVMRKLLPQNAPRPP